MHRTFGITLVTTVLLNKGCQLGLNLISPVSGEFTGALFALGCVWYFPSAYKCHVMDFYVLIYMCVRVCVLMHVLFVGYIFCLAWQCDWLLTGFL